MKITASGSQITQAINSFRKDYHADYFRVQEASKKYFSNLNPCSTDVALLAKKIRPVLENWGAGKRKAPRLRGMKEFELALSEQDLFAKLLELSQIKIPRLGLSGMEKLIDKERPKSNILKAVDNRIISILHDFSGKFFINNTNVTYPMKAALLIISHMPAYDGNVRAGLKRGGFQGFYSTRYLLPNDVNNVEAKKITSLPYMLGSCWNEYKDVIEEGVRKSEYPNLIDEPARVFDILLFVQANNSLPVMLENQNVQDIWYHLV